MTTVSINGLDGVGKTQQLSILQIKQTYPVHFLGSLNPYSDRWPSLKGGDLFEWWFKQVGMNDFLEIITKSLINRLKDARKGINFLDRGTQMYKAVCVAMFVTRGEKTFEEATEAVDNFFCSARVHAENHEFLLVPEDGYRVKIQPLLKLLRGRSGFSDDQNRLYGNYQANLTEAVSHYFAKLSDSRVISVDSSILCTQNKLRSLLTKDGLLKCSPLCEGLNRLVAIGGMSESGKSTVAEHLHDAVGSYRLKLKYFNELLCRVTDSWSSMDMANEIVRFLSTHYYVRDVSVESLHSNRLAAALKLMFGSKVIVAYLDVPYDLRLSRSLSGDDIAERDCQKQKGGGHLIKNIADLVLDNSIDDRGLGATKKIINKL